MILIFGKQAPLAGTFLVAEVRGNDVRLMDNEHRQSVRTTGTWNAAAAGVSTYNLVGPQYFVFFTIMVSVMGVIFIFVAARTR